MFSQFGDAAMSDALLLLRVEDLIGMAMGNEEKNTVNFKILQSVLHILARQMRMLEQAVELRICEGTRSMASGEDTEVDGITAKRPEIKRKSGKDKELTKDGAKAEGGQGGYKGKGRDQAIDDKYARRDKDRVDTKDKYKGEKSTSKYEKQESREERDEKQGKGKGREGRDSKVDKEEDRVTFKEKHEGRKGSDKYETRKSRDESERRGDRGESVDRGEKSEHVDKGEKSDRAGKDKRSGGGGKDRDIATDRSEKERGKDKDKSEREEFKHRSEKDKGREESGATSEKDSDRYRSGKDKKGERERGNDRSKKDEATFEADVDKSEKHRGRDISRGASENEDVEKSVKSRGKSEKDYDGERERDDDKRSGKSGDRSNKDRDKESSRGGDRKERVKTDKDAKKKSSGTSIAVSEREDKDQKILVVEKGPTTRRGDTTHVGSIEVVTQSQFKLLEQAVRSLESKTAPMPLPTLPDNKKLRADIAKGNASLTDTMQAMQITARIQAAEKAIERLTELTTEIAAKGGMPRELAKKAAALQSDVQSLVLEAKSATERADTTLAAHSIKLSQSKSQTSRKASHAATQPAGVASAMSRDTRDARDVDSTRTGVTLQTIEPPRPRSQSIRGNVSQATSVSRTASAFSTYGKYVTSEEMQEVLRSLKEELISNGKAMTSRAQTVADNAAHTAAEVMKKLEIALKMDTRITALCSVVQDYSEQLSGFDDGIGTQMSSFKEQMQELYKQLNDGLTQFANVSNNAETAAVMELNERYEGLDWELKDTQHYHQNLTNYQGHLSEELRSMVECVEMLREQKADREEVQDGLRDKADISRLAGLLSEEEFSKERYEVDMRLHSCHKKFNKQEAVWLGVLKDLRGATSTKAEHLQLMCIRAAAEDALRDLHARVQLLTRVLGDPETAVMIRKLAKDGVCGTCRVPAVMPVHDAHAGPRRLPAARAPPAGAPAEPEPRELCIRDIATHELDEPPEGKLHMCQRWVGGSHTLVPAARERPPPFMVPLAPAKRYVGLGTDSKPYKLAEDLLPCMECNQMTPEKIPGETDGPLQPSEVGSGDQVTVVKSSDARRVTIVYEDDLRRVADGEHRSIARLSKVEARSSTSPLGGGETVKASTASMIGERDASRQSLGATSTMSAYDDKPRRLADIGNIVKGRVTNVDENAVRRASIRYDTAVRRATIAEDGKRSDGETEDQGKPPEDQATEKT